MSLEGLIKKKRKKKGNPKRKGSCSSISEPVQKEHRKGNEKVDDGAAVKLGSPRGCAPSCLKAHL